MMLFFCGIVIFSGFVCVVFVVKVVLVKVVFVKKKKEIVIFVNIGKVNQKFKGVVFQVMDIFVKEVGCSYDEFVDNIVFIDFGVDFLMFLIVSGCICEEMDLDFYFNVFVDYFIIGVFKIYLV